MTQFNWFRCSVFLSLSWLVILGSCNTSNPLAETDDGKAAGDQDYSATITEDSQAIIGSWKSTKFEQNGTVDPTATGMVLEFTADTLYLGYGGPPFTYHLDPTQNPKHLDFKAHGSSEFTASIYRLEGDTLTINFSILPGKPRPTSFETKPGDKNHIVVYKRAETDSK